MVKFDDILSEIDEFGRFQKTRYALICLAALLPPICTYIHSFIAGKAAHRCTHPDIINDTYSFNASAYFNGSITFQQCTYTINDTKIECDKWVFDKTYYDYTLTEEWSMVCNRLFLRSNVQTVYFVGVLIGSPFFGILADRFGRRPVMLSSFVIIILGSAFAAFGPQKAFGMPVSYTLYTIGRFLTAVGTRGINVIGYVLALELVGPDKRTMAGIFFKYFFAFGQFFLVIMAYLIRDWRILASIVLACGFPFLSYTFFIPESLRWLVSKGRLEEAFTLLNKVCEDNKTKLKQDTWKDFLVSEANSGQNNRGESLITILKSPILATILLVLSLNWAANNFLFYGLGLKSNDLGLNPYLTYAISVACELAGYIVIFVLISKFGRKVPYFFFQLFAGICCFAIMFIDDSKAIVVMAMLGKFFSASTYAVIQLYSSEMFPTSLRNSCMGTCSMIARLGPIAAPMVNNLSDRGKALPFLVFGISGVFAALSTLVLPETMNRDLPQNVAETEKLFAIKCKCMKKLPKCLMCKL